MSSFQEKYLKYKQKYLELKNYAESNNLLGAGRSVEKFNEIISLNKEPTELQESENNLDSVEELQNELNLLDTEKIANVEEPQTGGADIHFDDFEFMDEFVAEEIEDVEDFDKDLEALFDEFDDDYQQSDFDI